MILIAILLTLICAYLLGSISTSVILSRTLFGSDIRDSGSHNAGATNMLRIHGKRLGIVVLVLDFAKGVIAVLLGRIFARMFFFTGYNYILDALPAISAFFASVGHDYPLYFGLKGGKGVATSLGALIALNGLAGLIACLIGVLIIAISKYVSLGSISGAIVFIILSILMLTLNIFDGINLLQFIFYVLIAGLLIYRHNSNISRFIQGTENKIKL